MTDDKLTYRRQGFGQDLDIVAPFGLLIVDFVNGFLDPVVFGGGNIAAAMEKTVGLVGEARRRGWPVAHSRIVFADDDADRNVFAMKVPGLLALKEGSSNSAIVSQLAPETDELVVRKTVPSAFFATGLAPWLTQRGVRTLVVAGCVTSGCVRASVVDAMSLGFLPLVVRDCVGDRAIGPHEANLFDMSEKYAVVMDLSDTLELVEAKTPGSAAVIGGSGRR
ncbi:isochorismatase family protein [Bradyrhizobium sp. CER78]|uniref:isochorismatase family protein n=1 Tax=Bradyrhizobium sp. CER78 TaxID=3039162 RepID=UPI00244CAB48|nr:isochorismatase family protein [Bradyrhizobium sp. CER78]MDH2384295.1 isochorismatase family protein [Bradyrhizobium sp. CER78]